MLNKSKWAPFLAFVALLPLAACGQEAGEMEEEPMEEEAAPAPMAEEPAMMEPMSVMMEPKNESGVTGEATATHSQDSVTVEVNISGASDGAYPAHVHSGDCASPGGVLAPLEPLEILGGAGSSITTIAASQVPADQNAVIQVHEPNGTPVSCGDLRGHGEMGGMEGGGGD